MLRQMTHPAALALAVFTALIGSADVCSAQHVVWDAFYRAADEAHTEKQRDLSLRLYSRALDEARREESDHLIAASAARVGEVLFEVGNYSAAEDSFRISLEAFKSQDAAKPDQDNTTLGQIDLVRVVRGLAASLQKQNKSGEAEDYLRHAIRIVSMRTTPDDTLMLELLNSLATCAYAQGDRLGAYALMKQATLHATTKLGANHHATAETSLMYAALLSDAGDHHAAAQMAQVAVGKLEQAVGSGHERVARARLFLGKMHHLRGATDEAKLSIAQARESLKAHHPDTHPIHGVADKLHDDAHGIAKTPGSGQKDADTQESPQK